MTNFTTIQRNFNGLETHIKGQEFELAKTHVGLTDGSGQGHTQSCPFCGGGKRGDRFYFRDDRGTFHCKKCKFASDLFDLIAKKHSVGRDEAFDIVAKDVGYGKPDSMSDDSTVSENAVGQQDTTPQEVDVDEVVDSLASESDSAMSTVNSDEPQASSERQQDCDVVDNMAVAIEPMKTTQNNAVEKYINAIKPIVEGERNNALYRIGLSLRTKFGLTGNDLESALFQVNKTKCTPPLSLGEVADIVGSVAKSDKPIGDTKKSKTSKQRTEYHIVPGVKPVPVADILKREVSLYSTCKSNTPMKTATIEAILNAIRTGGKSKERILEIRHENGKEQRDALKRELPAVVFGSEPQEHRKAEYCTPNGILCIDFDNISADKIDEAKQAIASVPYVFAVGLSVSGNGLFALTRYEGIPDLKTLLATMQADFQYPVDPARSDVNGLRFVSFDPDIIIKEEVYPAILNERCVTTLETATVHSDGDVEKPSTLYTTKFCDRMLKELDVDIFGQNEERHIYGYSNQTKQRFVIGNRNRYSLRDLIGDCGLIVDNYVVSEKSKSDDDDAEQCDDTKKYTVKQVIDVFVREAVKHPIRNYDLRGLGIWRDPETQHVVIVLGGGQAIVWNGTTLEKLTKPFYGDLQLNLQAGHAKFTDFNTLKVALENYDESKAIAAFADLRKLLMQWNWKTADKESTVTLIAALAVASFIQSTFKFRPQICIAGVTQSGKSSIQTELLVPLFGRLTDPPQQKPSEAAIRQSVECNSKILLIDELEKGKNRGEVLKLLRTSTDGGYVTRGQPNGKVQRFGLKHIVWISSIEMNLANLADASRFFQFEPQRPERIDGKRPLFNFDTQAIKKIGFDLMVFAIRNMQSLLQTVKDLSRADIAQAAPRNIEAAAVPAAFAESLCGWSREETLDFMYHAISDNSPMGSTEVTEDHDDLLQSILFQPIKVKDHADLSVIQAIKKAVDCDEASINIKHAEEALERSGIKIIKPHNSAHRVFFKPNVVKDVLLKNTEWNGMNVKQLLIRTDGAKEYTANFAGKSAKGISIPLENIMDEEFTTTSNQDAHRTSVSRQVHADFLESMEVPF